MIVINAVTETSQNGEAATPAFVWSMASQLGMHFPQAVDATKRLYKFASSTTISLPFQVAIDLRSMKVVSIGSGDLSKSSIEQLAAKTLGYK